jgi:hypothetical protein
MFYDDIIKLYILGIMCNLKDNDVLKYQHYIVGEMSCTFKFVKSLYERTLF